MSDLGASEAAIRRWKVGQWPLPAIIVRRLVRRLELRAERFDAEWLEARENARAELASALQQGKIILTEK